MDRPPGIVTIACALYVAWFLSFVVLPPIGKAVYQFAADPVHLVNYDAASVRALDHE